MPAWRIYYDDGSSFSSDEGEPHEAPVHGFLCAVCYSDLGKRYIISGKDHYCFDRGEGCWWGFDLQGILDRLRHRKEVYAYIEGRSVSAATWAEIMKRAHRDPDFPMVKPDD